MAAAFGRGLIVEDEPDGAAVLEYALRLAGASDVLVAVDGLAALDIAREQQPDLILCDLMLPGLDGLEVALRLRSGEPTVRAPLIFVTAAAHTAFKVKAPQEYGAAGVLPKPFEVQKLGQQILE